MKEADQVEVEEGRMVSILCFGFPSREMSNNNPEKNEGTGKGWKNRLVNSVSYQKQ